MPQGFGEWFWVILLLMALTPMLRRRMLEASRARAIGQLQKRG